MGCGKGCIGFWGRLDQHFGCHGNQILPLTYNGENDSSTFSKSLFFILAGVQDRHKISYAFAFQSDRSFHF